MIRQIVNETEPPGDAQSMFRLSINANLIAKGVTAAQAYYLVGEVLRRIGPRNALRRGCSTRTVMQARACAYPRRRLKVWERDGAVVPTNAFGCKNGAKRQKLGSS